MRPLFASRAALVCLLLAASTLVECRHRHGKAKLPKFYNNNAGRYKDHSYPTECACSDSTPRPEFKHFCQQLDTGCTINLNGTELRPYECSCWKATVRPYLKSFCEQYGPCTDADTHRFFQWKPEECACLKGTYKPYLRQLCEPFGDCTPQDVPNSSIPTMKPFTLLECRCDETHSTVKPHLKSLCNTFGGCSSDYTYWSAYWTIWPDGGTTG